MGVGERGGNIIGRSPLWNMIWAWIIIFQNFSSVSNYVYDQCKKAKNLDTAKT